MNKNEAFSRVMIDAMLANQGWNTTDPNAVRFEVVMPDSTRADYVLCDRNGHSLGISLINCHVVSNYNGGLLQRSRIVAVLANRHINGRLL